MYHKGLGESIEEAEGLLNDFYTSFPKVKQYLDFQAYEALTKGYNQDYFGRIRWYEIPQVTLANRKLVEDKKKSVKRQAQNFSIQSLSASVTKQALLDCYTYLKETGFGFMILTVHDSIFFEIKDKHLETAIPELKRIMQEAGTKILPTLKAPVDFDIGHKITKKDEATGEKFKVHKYVYEEGKILLNYDRFSENTLKIMRNKGISEDEPLEDIKRKLAA